MTPAIAPPPPDAQPLKLDRLADGDTAAVIDQLRGSGLMAEGKVILVGLEAVRARFSQRWLNKREQVWEQVERCFARRLGACGFAVRVSEVDYMVAQPDVSRHGGQAVCMAVLKEVLTFFLGEARQVDLVLREVTSLSAGGLDCRPVDPMASITESEGPSTDLGAPVASASPAAAFSPPMVPIEPPSSTDAHALATAQARHLVAFAQAKSESEADADASPDRWSPFVATNGRTLRVSCRMDPVFEMQQVRLVGHRLEPVVTDVSAGAVLDPDGLRALSPGDRERVDLATIARGVNRMRSAGADTKQPLIMLPAAFTTLGSARGRAALVRALSEAKLEAWTRIVCEIGELEGAPLSRLIDSISLIKPFCYATVGRVGSQDAREIDLVAKSGFAGVSMEFNPMDNEQVFLRQLQAFATRSKGRLKVCMAFGLSSPRHLALARLAGITHAAKRGGVRVEGPAFTSVL